MKDPAFLTLAKKYLSHAMSAEDLEREFLELRRAQVQSNQHDFDLADPSVGLGYDLIFSLIDRLYLGDDPEDSDISENYFRMELSKIVEKINNGSPQKPPF